MYSARFSFFYHALNPKVNMIARIKRPLLNRMVTYAI